MVSKLLNTDALNGNVVKQDIVKCNVALKGYLLVSPN